jgi:hypothetical protein
MSRQPLIFLACFSLLLASLACGDTASRSGSTPDTAIEANDWSDIGGNMEVNISGLQRGVDVSDLVMTFEIPLEDHEVILIEINVACQPEVESCEVDSGDFSLFGDKATIYNEEEKWPVENHLATERPGSVMDVLSFDYGNTLIPGGRTRTAYLVFQVYPDDKNFILNYRDILYFHVPEE